MLDIQGKQCSSQLIKQALKPHLGQIVKIKYNLGRNKYESFNAKIVKIYNCVFLVETEDHTIKSFSYADIITKTIKIYDKC
jgi:uncharacterized protein Veg